MKTYTYRSKGTNDDWTNDTVEAESVADAQEKLDAIYGILRDDEGNQINGNMIMVELA